MIRTLNYTGRKKIEKKDVRITVRAGIGDEPATFDARLDLGSYGFPAEGRVFVEAYRQTQYQRFAFGTVGDVQAPEDRALSEFENGDGVHFRVKVVGPEGDPGDPRPARLLGEADQITPKFAGRKKSLLHVLPGEFRDEVWRLEIKESNPILYVSRHLARNWNELVGRAEFVSLVLPEIFRRILKEAFDQGVEPEDSPDHWACKWVRLAEGLHRGRESPWDMEDDDRTEWIEEAVEAFARQRRVADRFKKWWRAGDEEGGA